MTSAPSIPTTTACDRYDVSGRCEVPPSRGAPMYIGLGTLIIIIILLIIIL